MISILFHIINRVGDMDAERLEVVWKIQTKSYCIEDVCRRAFCIAYDIGTTTLSKLCSEIKV